MMSQFKQSLPTARGINYPIMPDQLPPFLPAIEGLATGTPDHITPQIDAANFVANLRFSERNQARIQKIYQNTRIDTRHLAVNLLTPETVNFSRQSNTLEQRTRMYADYALPLAETVVRKAIDRAAEHLNPAQPTNWDTIEAAIGLIVFVTSTGFLAPGIDAQLVKNLGLQRSIARLPVHFMGCAAAMNGLRVAADYIRANPDRKALVVCLELSSVNAVFEDDLNDIIIHSLFGDGCAAVILGAHQVEQLASPGKIVIKSHLSYLAEDTEDGITLGIRDNGVTCKLSPQLPNYIESALAPVIHDFLGEQGLTQADIDLWAVHPGGTRIIEKVQSSLGLRDEQVLVTWDVLREYGNMLSCAVLFVLEKMLADRLATGNSDPGIETLNSHCDPALLTQTPLTGLAFSFAPGVGIEGLLFQTT